jgi:shikimate dehydrogenase
MLFAVIGNPVAHSLSPAMHRAAYRALGLDHDYEKLEVTDLPGQIEDIMKLDGINVTIPHKEAVAAYCQPDDFANRAGSVNTIDWRTNQGINTDGPGFLDILPEGVQNVLILGAGGTTRSLALALTQALKQVTIWNRTEARAHQLLNDLDIHARVSSIPDLRGQDAIVNATATGLTGEVLPLDWGQAEAGAIAIELAYGKEPTPFEHDAARAGLRTIDGRELLIAQGARSFKWWLGIDAPVEAMRAAVYGQGES